MTDRTRGACRLATFIFGLVSFLHIVRIVTRTKVLIGNWPVPLMLSWVASLLSGILAWWMWRTSRSS
ncbi:MAG: hypothetical protein HYZ89_07640 [Candidatus Omnitrophica bacterium]|nr:hypothetical protein [Candidatus Omnitrophota bacterium]